MIIGPDNLFALPDMRMLLQAELALIGVHAERQTAGRALVVQACGANRDLAVDARHLRVVRLHARGEGLAGDVVCASAAWPFEDDAFRLIVVQHAGDVVPSRGPLLDELARVLAPGGVLLWFGLNPWSPWLAWVHWKARGGLPLPRTAPADIVRLRLLRRQLAPVSVDYLGSWWPSRDGAPAESHGTGMLRPFREAYLLTASKQRAVLTPLRPHRVRVAMQPALAVPSQRACA